MSKPKRRVRPPRNSDYERKAEIRYQHKRKAKVRYEEKRRKKYNGNRPPHMPYSPDTEEEIP